MLSYPIYHLHQGLAANRSHSTLVLPTGPPKVSAYFCSLLSFPNRLGSASLDVTFPELFRTRKRARALVLMKRDKRDDKPRLRVGLANKYINAPKEKNNKPYSGEGDLKKRWRKQEVMEKPRGRA